MAPCLNRDSLAFDELPRGNGGIGATEQIARVLDESGIDVPSKLYDEALGIRSRWTTGHGQCPSGMLLVLDPSDGEAAMLLGKVLASQGKWQESLTHLDSAASKGARLPEGLRDSVEVQLRKKVQDAEAQRSKLVDRERGIALSSKRSEKLTQENAALEQQAFDLARKAKLWSRPQRLWPVQPLRCYSPLWSSEAEKRSNKLRKKKWPAPKS